MDAGVNIYRVLGPRDGESLRLRTSYPLLPWIGVIALGYAVGPWFPAKVPAAARQRGLWTAGIAGLIGFEGAARISKGQAGPGPCLGNGLGRQPIAIALDQLAAMAG